jgi:hypothetical protein
VNLPEITHWRSVVAPMTPLDPVGDPNTPTYQAGELPVGFVLLLWDGRQIIGPTQIANAAAGRIVLKQKSITHFMVIPKPD